MPILQIPCIIAITFAIILICTGPAPADQTSLAGIFICVIWQLWPTFWRQHHNSKSHDFGDLWIE